MDDESFEASDGFASALAFADFASDVGLRGLVRVQLHDRHAMNGGVELSVAAAVQSVAVSGAA